MLGGVQRTELTIIVPVLTSWIYNVLFVIRQWKVHPLVTVQSRRVIEPLAADGALERFLSGVNSDVPPQLGMFNKTPTANVTLVGAFSGVPPHVNNQRGFPREAFFAHRALERFLAIVRFLVREEHAPVDEAFTAIGAMVRFISRMCFLVSE